MVYIVRAVVEFDELKECYLKWAQERDLGLAGKSEEEKEKILANPNVPELVVNMTVDRKEF